MSNQAVENVRPLLAAVLMKASHLYIPTGVTLELTYRCNLRCSHCYVDLVEPDELSLEEWQEVMDQLKAAGTIYLSFTGGEIMVRHDLLDILAYARQTGFVITLLTNCTLVTPEVARAFAGLKISTINTSLYGATAATHEQVTRVPGSFERTLAGIKSLVDVGIRPKVQTLIMEGNVAEYSQIKKLVADLGAIARINLGEIVPTKSGVDLPFQHEPSIETLLNCDARQDIARAIPVQEGKHHLTCKAGYSVGSVSPQGDVFPCTAFPLKLGNLRESSFDSIWRLEPCAELRYLRSMRRSDLYACHSCELAEYCMRCTGSVYSETGQMNGPSPSACRQAKVRWRLAQVKEVIAYEGNLSETRDSIRSS